MTSDGIVTKADMQAIADQIDRVYEDGDYVGSLVVDGPTGRPTECGEPCPERSRGAPGWWQAFWTRFEDSVGLDREGALGLLRKLGVVARRWALGLPRE